MPPTRKAPAPATPLQRGLACLSCRKRKLKCDGKRPVCSSCTKMKREEECEYEDKKQKSRTQKLKEKLAMLEERIRELEGPNEGTSGSDGASSSSPPGTFYDPPVQLHATAQLLAPPDLDSVDLSSLSEAGGSRPVSVAAWPPGSTASSASSSDGSLGGISRSVTGSPFSSGNIDLEQLLGIGSTDFSGNTFDFANPFGSTNFMNTNLPVIPQWDPKTPLPEENKRILLDLFYAHRHQCWFDGDFSRYDTTKSTQPLHQPYSEPHPALMNSIYLLACYFARSPFYAQMENTFLTRTLHEITVALDQSDRLVDVVQASCLLAVYLFANSRILEGYCHSFSAARLAVGLGLHQLQHPNSFSVQGASADSKKSSKSKTNPLPGLITGLGPSGASPIPISPPQTDAELRDRISAFWQVFMVDRCWSVANGLPVALPDGEHHQGRIKTPWPEPPDGGSTGILNNDPSFSNVFVPALKAKAAALYERTFRLASASNKGDAYWAEHNATILALQRFSAALPFFVGYEAWRTQAPFLDVDLFTVHTLVNVCNIHLHGGVVQSIEMDMNNSSVPLQAANYIMSLIRQLSQGDYEFLDPLISACWLSVAKVYVQLLNAVAVGTVNSFPAYAIEGELEYISNAMKTLSVYVPLAGEHAKKVEQERGITGGVI
ncbi:hypothetical protein AAF712_002351 [Marasmius tenuissimus]|uniref:Zn(2)-C6 fungal-type domain-containing protein n=1 Tax=Marasmius tenuissimus TaxID=585030 RepID=A0ABR3ABY7_9AGAR